MAFLKRLNGWQRMWLVIAILGYVVIGAYIVYETGDDLIHDRYVLRGLHDSKCGFVYSLPAGLDRLESSTRIRDLDCYYLYEYLQSVQKPLAAAQYLEHYESRRNNLLISGVVFYWGLWTFIVAITYGSVLVVAWVRRGFAKRDERDVA